MTSVTGNGVGMASRKIAATTTSSSSSSSSSSSRRKNVTTPLVNRMFEQVLSTISKPSDDRINSDITMIAAWLSKRFDVFKQLNQGVVVKLLKYCEYQRVVRDQIITRQGEKGDCFYIQLTGKTSLYIDMTKALINQQVAPEPPAPTTAADVQLDDQISDEWIEEWDGKGHKRMKLDRSKFGHFIKNFDAGKGFGELALLTENAVRSGSIIADDVTDLLVIRKQLFDDTLKSKQEDEFRERKGFIDGSALFANWMPQLKRLLEISLRKEFFPYGSFIVRQCQRVTGLLFIIRGEGEVTTDPTLHHVQYSKLVRSRQATADEQRSEFVTGARLDKASGAPRSSPATTMTTTSPTGTASDGFLRLKGHFPAEQRPTTSKVKSICFIGQGEIIGAMELIAGLTSHAHNVVATRDTEVFVLDNRNIDRIICHNKLTPTIDTLYKTVIDKLQLRATSTVSQQCELYRILLGKLMGRRPSIDVSKQVPSTDGDIDVQTSSQTTSGGGVAGTGQYDDDRYTSSLLQQAAAGRQGPLHPLSKQPESTSFDVAKLRYRTKVVNKTTRLNTAFYQLRKSTTSATSAAAVAGGAKVSAGNVMSRDAMMMVTKHAVRLLPRSHRQLRRICKANIENDPTAKSLLDPNHPVHSYFAEHSSSVSTAFPSRSSRVTSALCPSDTTSTYARSRPYTAATVATDRCQANGIDSVSDKIPSRLRIPLEDDSDDDRWYNFGSDSSETETDDDALASDSLLQDENQLFEVAVRLDECKQRMLASRQALIARRISSAPAASVYNRRLLRARRLESTPFGLSDSLATASTPEFDWETGDHALSTLEQKLHNFHCKELNLRSQIAATTTPNGGSPGGVTKRQANIVIQPMKRFTLNTADDVPLPPGSVYVRPTSSQRSSDIPQHVARRVIITKNDYSTMQKVHSNHSTQYTPVPVQHQ